MGVSNDAALMHIFSATLYTYPKLATVREIICNAWDAHIAAGITDRPIEVNVADGRVTVRDFGYGIAHAKIGEIYGTYGNSTKRDDSTVTGGFGLGSKAPFAYTDNFEVISHHVGTKTIYRVSKSSMEKDGKQVEIISVHPAASTDWYLSVGQGMGKTLTMADEKQAYTLADRGTYIKYKYGREVPVNLEILCEGGNQLANPYGFIPVSQAKHPHVKAELADQMAKWLVSAKGQQVIADYKLHGKQLFFGDAK